MAKKIIYQNKYRPTYRGKVKVEDALKHQEFIDNMKKDASFYLLDHIESCVIPNSLLHKIIQKLKMKSNDAFTLQERTYLIRQNLHALHDFIEGKITFSQYKKEAIKDKLIYLEQLAQESLRLEKVKEIEQIAIVKEQARLAKERKLREQADRERKEQLANNPQLLALQKEKVLLNKYEIYNQSIAHKLRSNLLRVLNFLEAQKRLDDHDAIWLSTDGRDFFTDTVKLQFHRIEADFYLNQFKVTKSEWSAINASSHLRKCKASQEAEKFLENSQIASNKNFKLLSAYYTTLGGVKRDLKKSDVAIDLGLKAHTQSSQDYRPCTLLGALYMERHEYNLGHDWYVKARERGAPENTINSDLRSILMKLSKNQRNQMILSLLKKDSYLYDWLKELNH